MGSAVQLQEVVAIFLYVVPSHAQRSILRVLIPGLRPLSQGPRPCFLEPRRPTEMQANIEVRRAFSTWPLDALTTELCFVIAGFRSSRQTQTSLEGLGG